MIHYNTSNNSFLKVHLFLKKKGVKNNSFFLELYDETLKDIDPFDEENLTEEQKQKKHEDLIKEVDDHLREKDFDKDFNLYRIWTKGEFIVILGFQLK